MTELRSGSRPRGTAWDDAARDESGGNGSVRVLVVDDDEQTRTAIRALLESYGYAVAEAAHGEAAVAEARRRPPDLILMDLVMPVMDGLEAIRRIRRTPDLAEVPVVCVSAMEGAREAATRAGFDDCLTKPLDMGRFLEQVDGWLAAS